QAPDENQLTVLFDASKSYDPDPLPSSSLKYRWEFGDGRGRSSELKGSYDYTKPGDYSVTLTVEDEGEVSQKTISVSVHTYLEKLLQDRIQNGIIKATLKDAYIVPHNKGSMILFEDQHRTSEVQTEIAKSLQGLVDIIDFIPLEGEWMSLDELLSWWQTLNENIAEMRKLLPWLAWGWLENNCISASEYHVLATQNYSLLKPAESGSEYEAHRGCLKTCDGKLDTCLANLKDCIYTCIAKDPRFDELVKRCHSEKECITRDPLFKILLEECESKCVKSCEKDYESCTELCNRRMPDRDKAIASNIVQLLKRSTLKVGAMQIGLFHVSEDSVTKELRQREVSYYVLAPLHIEKCKKDSVSCHSVDPLKYWDICDWIKQTPLERAIKWLSEVIPPTPHEVGIPSKEFQSKVVGQLNRSLALYLLAQGFTIQQVQQIFERLSRKVQGIRFPDELKNVDVRLAFTRSFQDASGTSIEEFYLILENRARKKRAFIKIPEALYSDRGIVYLGTDISWPSNLNVHMDDLLTLPQNGPALADLFAALRTPGAAQTWEWQRADGSWVYARLSKSKRIEDGAEKEVGTITQITRDEYQKDLVTRLQPLLEMIKDKITRNKLEADFNALRKLDAWARYPIYPQILVLQVDNRLLLATRKGEKQEVKEMDPKVTAILKKLEPIINDPVEYLLDRVLTPDERTLVIDTIKSLVAQWSPQVVEEIKVRDEEQIKEYRITLDLKGQPFIRFDLPENPVLRLLVPYLLRGNRAVGIAEPSTVLDIERKLASAFIDHNKLKLVFSLPWSKVNKLPEPYRSNIIQQYRDAIKGLQEKIKEHGLGIEVIDLTDLSPQEAKNKLTDLLQEKDNLVLTFWEAKDERTLEIGQDGSITQDEVESTKPVRLWVALRALSGCNSYRTRWPDIIIEKYGGVVSLGFWQEISIGDAFRLANKLVERLADELRRNPAPPSLIPLLLDILEGLPGLVVVEVPSGRTRG
ncbi:MAG: PKD domain-containing protein, partial [Candidatus Hadarchaeum sp.]